MWTVYEEAYRAANARRPELPITAELQRLRANAPELPPFQLLFGDPDGNVWIGAYGMDLNHRAPPRFEVVTSQGVWLGGVDVPPGLQILAIGHDYVLGMYRNDVRSFEVAMYRIER